jgi:NAD(P)-dependent dehydrogenase (short-subunit alcohol dehydrogenase family)
MSADRVTATYLIETPHSLEHAAEVLVEVEGRALIGTIIKPSFGLSIAVLRVAGMRAIGVGRTGYGTSKEAVSYLASEDAGYVTGTVLPLDGGFLASGAPQW